MIHSFSRLHLILILILSPLAVLAQPHTATAHAEQKTAKPAGDRPMAEEQVSVTEHSATIGGKKIAYNVEAGTLNLKTEEGKPRASIFYMAYTQTGNIDRAKRPIMFSFNGGPGSSSVWLHLGVLGPKRVHMDEDGNPYPPPYSMVNNDYSILDKADLVFIDPVATGYSRSAPDTPDSQFHGLEEDIESVGEFIRRWITRNERWASPKFLIGESYGTTRATGLVNHLQSRHGMFFNGIALVSSILDFGTARFNEGNDLPYILFLPTYTATAWYHKKLPQDLMANLEETLQKARDFAYGDYATALLKGDALPENDRKKVLTELARFTGLKAEYLEKRNMRVPIFTFVDELRSDEYLRVGRLDSRFTGIKRGDAFSFGSDPSYAAIQGPYTATLNDYVRRELKFETDLTYEILGGRIKSWNYSDFENRYVNVAPRLREALVRNPALKIWIANGYYDLATPFFATEYTIDHLNLGPELRKNISMDYYESGHMMYIHIPSLKAFKDDLAKFVNESCNCK